MRACPNCNKHFTARKSGRCPSCQVELRYVGNKGKLTITNDEDEFYLHIISVFDKLLSKSCGARYYADTSEKGQYYRLLANCRVFLIRQKRDPRQATRLLEEILICFFEHKDLQFATVYSLADIKGKLFTRGAMLALRQLIQLEQKKTYEQNKLSYGNYLKETVLAL